MIRAAAAAGDARWVPAIGMDDTDLTVIDYLPGALPAGVVCITRPTLLPVE